MRTPRPFRPFSMCLFLAAALSLGLSACGDEEVCSTSTPCPSGFTCVAPITGEEGNTCLLSCVYEGACPPGYMCGACVGMSGFARECQSACLPADDPRLNRYSYGDTETTRDGDAPGSTVR